MKKLMLTRAPTELIAKSFSFIAFQLLMCLQLFACWLHVTRQSHLNLVHCLATIWNGPFAWNGHVVQNLRFWMWSYALGHLKQREKVKHDWFKRLCFGGCCIVLPSNVADFCTVWPVHANGPLPDDPLHNAPECDQWKDWLYNVIKGELVM